MLETEAKKALQRNYSIYQNLVDIALDYHNKQRPEDALNWVTIATSFAWECHTGLFSDGRLEKIAFEIGEKLDFLSVTWKSLSAQQVIPKSSKKRVLHVATTVFSTGGHTRLIKNWIKSFPNFEHWLLLINQRVGSVPPFLSETVTANSGQIIILPDKDSLLAKAKNLRQIACNNFDYVFLHHHPNDVVPLVAFAIDNCPPVAVVNHADHVFWVGVSIADLVIDFCRSGCEISLERRIAKKSVIVPYLVDVIEPTISRTSARQQLSINEDETILLSIGSAYKFQPIEERNFFVTAEKILEKNSKARLFLIGPDDNCGTGALKNNRIKFLGRVEDPILYQIAADIYLEGFPMGGGLASIESVLLGACPVFAYNSLPLLSTIRLLEFENEVKTEQTENDYIADVSKLIENSDLRKNRAEKLRRRIIYLHSRERFEYYTEITFQYLDSIEHRPDVIPFSSPLAKPEDISLSLVQAARGEDCPFLLKCYWQSNANINTSQIVRLLTLSVKTGDTNFTIKHLRAMLSMIKATVKDKITASVVNQY